MCLQEPWISNIIRLPTQLPFNMLQTHSITQILSNPINQSLLHDKVDEQGSWKAALVKLIDGRLKWRVDFTMPFIIFHKSMDEVKFNGLWN